MSKVRLIHITPDTEKHIAYCARVSSPNQDNPEYAKLIQYLIKHKHWSPTEMASACFEIETTRAVAPQLLRHRSFSFQEFSQRYSKATEVEITQARRQDLKNKQNSIDDMSDEDKQWFLDAQQQVWDTSNKLYEEALSRGVAKEAARGLLPLNTKTKLYMHGTIRSWIHYVEVRSDVSTQLEHREIALAIKEILKKEIPQIAEALGW
jgi:thymidylate synthase (FAD)